MKETINNFIKAIFGLLVILAFFVLVDIFVKPYEPSPKDELDTFENYDGHL